MGKIVVAFLLILSLFFAKCGIKNGMQDTDNVNTTFKVIYNSKFSVFKEDYLYNFHIYNCNCDSITIVYEKKDVAYSDYINYEDDVVQLLIFTIPSEFDKLKFSDNDLSNINLLYLFNCFSKIPISEIKNIKKGIVEISKNFDGTIKLHVDVDAEFQYGGFFSKTDSGLIKFSKNNLTVDAIQ